MPTQHGEVVGHVKAIYCYPVKSMRGKSLAEARLGFRGLAGDRRFAFIQTAITSGFPRLMDCQLPGMVRYTPSFIDPSELHKGELLGERLEHGAQRTYDIAEVSLVTTGTLNGLSGLVGASLESLHFGPNIPIETFSHLDSYPENDRVGRMLALGAEVDATSDAESLGGSVGLETGKQPSPPSPPHEPRPAAVWAHSLPVLMPIIPLLCSVIRCRIIQLENGPMFPWW